MEKHLSYKLPEDFTKNKEVLIHKAEIQGEFLKVTYEEKDKLSDGDFFTVKECIGIFRGKGPTPDSDLIPFYVGWIKGDDSIYLCKEEEYNYSGFGHFSENCRKATLEEIALFKRKLAANGYMWDDEKKELKRFFPKGSIIVHRQNNIDSYYFISENLSKNNTQVGVYACLNKTPEVRITLGGSIFFYGPEFVDKARLAIAKEVMDFFHTIKEEKGLKWSFQKKEFVYVPEESQKYYYLDKNFEIRSREYTGELDSLSREHRIKRNMFKTYEIASKAREEILRCLKTFNTSL